MSGQTYDQGDGALQAAPREGMVKLANILYLLLGISVVMGLVTSASVVGSFVFSLPSIVAVILNYLQRSEVRGTYLDSHFGCRSAPSCMASAASPWRGCSWSRSSASPSPCCWGRAPACG